MRKFGLYGLGVLLFLGLSVPAFAEGDTTKGKAAFAKCAICHQVGPGATTLVGPELNGIVGRKAASVADYTPYSAGIRSLANRVGSGRTRISTSGSPIQKPCCQSPQCRSHSKGFSRLRSVPMSSLI